MENKMIVKLIGRPDSSLGMFPPELGVPRRDQLRGDDAQRIIEIAGRVCYDSFGKGRSSAEYAQHILDSGHGSVLEHAQYTFFISGVSRGLTHELVRHRVGVAISQRSTRYCDESASPWIKHPLLENYLAESNDLDLAGDWNQAIESCRKVYDKIAARLQEHLLSKGIDKLTARKQARGAARGVLGNALETELVWSANVRALRHVITMRGDAAADAEIRGLAVHLLEIMKQELPIYFDDFEAGASADVGEIVTRKK